MCTWNDIGGCYMNQKHSEIPFRTLGKHAFFNFHRFKRFYAFLKDFEIFDSYFFPVTRLLVTYLISTIFVTLIRYGWLNTEKSHANVHN